MKATSSIRNIMYLSKNAEKSAQFFVDVFGFKLNHFSINYSELVDSNQNKIVFLKTNSDAQSRVGYSPILHIDVVDFDSVKIKLENYTDVQFDGDIKENEIGKYACLKTSEGIIIGITELKKPEIDNEEFSVDYNEDSKLDSNTSEIRNILEKIKI